MLDDASIGMGYSILDFGYTLIEIFHSLDTHSDNIWFLIRLWIIANFRSSAFTTDFKTINVLKMTNRQQNGTTNQLIDNKKEVKCEVQCSGFVL